MRTGFPWCARAFSLVAPIPLLLAVRSNTGEPRIIRDPCVAVVTCSPKALGRVLCVKRLPQIGVVLLAEAWIAFSARNFHNLHCSVPTLINFLEKNAVYLAGFLGAGLDKLYDKI